MTRIQTRISQFRQGVILTGLAIALLGASAAPLLGSQDVAAANVQTITRSFSSTSETITVSGLEQGKILDVNITLAGFSTKYADDIDILIEHGSTNLILMSDAGGDNAASNLTLKFDDSAPAELPDETALSSGTFLPANYLFKGGDTFA